MNKNNFCSVKDMIPNHIYYGASCWRNVWVYLGRNSKKEFVYLFIGNEEYLLKHSMKNDVLEHIRRLKFETLSVTKANKKLKPIGFLREESNLVGADNLPIYEKIQQKLSNFQFDTDELDMITSIFNDSKPAWY